MQLAEATKLNDVVRTTSPSPTPAAMTQRCSHDVPLLTPIACAVPTDAARRRSKSSSRGPSARGVPAALIRVPGAVNAEVRPGKAPPRLSVTAGLRGASRSAYRRGDVGRGY